MSTYSQTLTIQIANKISMKGMRMNDDEMSMRWSNRARSIPEISVQRKPRRVQTMEEMKNEKDES